jgi:hypothetical protein
MKVRVNNKTYHYAMWSVDSTTGQSVLNIVTDETIAEVAATFSGDDTVEVLNDNDTVVCIWYVHTVMGVYENYESQPEGEGRQVVILLKASALDAEAEEALGEGIGDNMDAIIELAGMVSDGGELEIRVNNIEGKLEGIPQNLLERFDEVWNAYTALSDRVSNLENRLEGE